MSISDFLVAKKAAKQMIKFLKIKQKERKDEEERLKKKKDDDEEAFKKDLESTMNKKKN